MVGRIRSLVASIVVACCGPSVALAQESASAYPSRPIRLVSSGLAGGLTDVVARVLGERLGASPEMRGQQAIVDNKPGGSGVIAAMFVAKSAPDGYNLLVADLTQTSINPALLAKPPYETLRDFAPISLLGTTPFFLSVNSAIGTATLRDFVAYVKANPGKLSYGTSGTGSIHHLAFATLVSRLGLEMTHVPYKSSGQSTPAMIAGDVQVLFTALGPMAPHVKSDKAFLLAVASPTRAPQAPEVPTFAELGVKDMNFLPSVGLLAPAGTPQPILAKLSSEVQKALKHADAVRRFEGLGIDPVGTTPDQYAALLAADVAAFAQAVKLSGARVE